METSPDRFSIFFFFLFEMNRDTDEIDGNRQWEMPVRAFVKSDPALDPQLQAPTHVRAMEFFIIRWRDDSDNIYRSQTGRRSSW